MKRHALFVGVDQYADPTIQNLRCAVNDATELAGIFLHRAKFDASEALLNPRCREEILDRVAALTDGLGRGDVFLFFFAGHGFSVKDGHILVCSEDSYKDVKREWRGLPMELLDAKTSGAFDRIFMLDACRTDILAGNRGAAKGMTKTDRDLIFRLAEKPQTSGGGHLSILCSCDEGQSAGELVAQSHGLFSLALIEELGRAFDEGRSVEISDAFQEKIGIRMRQLAGRAGFPSRQRPQKMGPSICLAKVVSDNEPRQSDSTSGNARKTPRRRHARTNDWDCASREREERIREEADRLFRSAEREPGEQIKFQIGKIPLAFRWCPPGTIRVVYNVWADVAPGYREAAETHERLELVKGFWMGETEVTQALWAEIMGNNPSRNRALFGGMRSNHPVDGVSWDDCQAFILALGRRAELTDSGLSFRLPSRSEREYAAKAGFSNWPDYQAMDRMGWQCFNAKPHRVKTAQPNPWGLYDLFGNVMEWCRDGETKEGDFQPFFTNRDFSANFLTRSQSFTGGPGYPHDWWIGLRLSAVSNAEGRQTT